MLASAPGTVYNKTNPGGYGNYVDIAHTGGWVTRYAHLSAFGVANGSSVGQGTRIGAVGTTGNSTGDHIHYEQRLNNVAQAITFNGSAIAYSYSGTSYRSSNCGSGSYPDGTFISTPDGAVFRLAGGAPVYVSTWTIYGGAQPTTPVPNLGQFRAFPADGTFVAAQQTGEVFKMAGGAPLYVSAADATQVPGYSGATVVGIDKWSIDNATHPLAHLRPYPVDGTFVSNVGTGEVFKVAGGAPLYVSAADATQVPGYNGGANVVAASAFEFSNYHHLRRYPADGTFVNNLGNGGTYKVVGGSPILVTAQNAALIPGYEGGRTTVISSAWEFGNFWHLRPMPADGSLVAGLPSATGWSIAGGCRTSNDGSSGYIVVDDLGLERIPVCTTPIIVPGLVTVTEGDSGSQVARIPVTLSAPSSRTVTATWQTANHTATTPDDYVATSGTLSFAPGQTDTFVEVTINGDTTDELDEILLAAFSNPTNATLGGFYGLGFASIIDNDPTPT